MSEVQWFAPPGVCVLMLPRGVACDLPGGHRAVLTRRNLWFSTERGVGRVAMTGRSRLRANAAGALVTQDGGRQVWLCDGDVRVHDDPSARVGIDLAISRAPGGPWTSEALPLSNGAQWSAQTRPFPSGTGVVWCAEGFLYRRSEGLTTAVCAQTPYSLGPRGALLLGDPLQAYASPGQPMRRLQRPVLGPLAWSSSGMSALGCDLQRRPVCVDLSNGNVTTAVAPNALQAFTFWDGAQLCSYGPDGIGQRMDGHGQMSPAPSFDGEIVEARSGGFVDSEDQCWKLGASGLTQVHTLAICTRPRVSGIRLIGSHVVASHTLGWSATGLLLRWPTDLPEL